MTRVETAVVGCVIGAGCITSLIMFDRLAVYPVPVATLLPLTAAVIYLVIRSVGKRSATSGAQEPITRIALHVVIFIICLHVLVVCTVAGVGWARALGPRAPVVLLGLAIAAAGNVLPLLRPNLAVGIPTSRSLGDGRLWSRLHRQAGHAAVTLGVVICAAGLFIPGQLIGPVIALSAMTLGVSTALSYRRLTHD